MPCPSHLDTRYQLRNSLNNNSSLSTERYRLPCRSATFPRRHRESTHPSVISMLMPAQLITNCSWPEHRSPRLVPALNVPEPSERVTLHGLIGCKTARPSTSCLGIILPLLSSKHEQPHAFANPHLIQSVLVLAQSRRPAPARIPSRSGRHRRRGQ